MDRRCPGLYPNCGLQQECCRIFYEVDARPGRCPISRWSLPGSGSQSIGLVDRGWWPGLGRRRCDLSLDDLPVLWRYSLARGTLCLNAAFHRVFVPDQPEWIALLRGICGLAWFWRLAGTGWK